MQPKMEEKNYRVCQEESSVLFSEFYNVCSIFQIFLDLILL